MMTPMQYLEEREECLKIIRSANNKIEEAKEEALKCPIPSSLRPATGKDIFAGNVIWYKSGDNGPFWQVVKEVCDPNDDWKAYVAEGGSRYGLDDAWIAAE